MALKIIKWFPAIIALVQCLAGGRSKLAQEFCIGGVALGAFDLWLILVDFIRGVLRWRNSVGF